MKFTICCCTGLGNLFLKGKMLDIIYKNLSKDITLIMDERWDYANLIKQDKRNFKLHLTDTLFSFKKLIKFINLINISKNEILIYPFDSSPAWLILFGSFFFNGEIIIHYHKRFSLKYLLFLFSIKILRFGRRCTFVSLKKSIHEENLNIDLIAKFISNLDKEKILNSERGFKIFSEIISKNKTIVIQASARNGLKTPKIWNSNNFKNIISYISKKYPSHKIIMVGDKNESQYINKIIKGSDAINLSGKIKLTELVKIIYQSELVICHDSSVMHIADSKNIPTIALLGPTDLSRTGPRSEKTYPLVSVNESTMYMYNFQENEDSTLEIFKKDYCMKDIRTDMVKSFIDLLISKR